MRLTITIPRALEEIFREQATTAHRYPKQQAEYLLWRAIEQTASEHEAQIAEVFDEAE